MSVAISIENVIKRFGKDTIINGLSLDVRPGEFFTLLGPSGCGKTTLLRMIIGFNSIEGGEIKIDGKVINNIPTNKRNMGMVFQNYAIFPHMSVRDNVAFGLKNRKVPQDQIESQVDEILKVVKIDHLKKRMPSKLSGGQQQRVALARAIVTKPKVLLLDEPLSAIDAKLRKSLQIEIRRIQKELNITTIFVTHDQDEAMIMSDRICLLNEGRIEQLGKPIEIYTDPKTRFAAGFIGNYNVLGPAEFRLLTGLTPAAGDSIAIRPETIAISREKQNPAGSYEWEGTVLESRSRGNVLRYTILVNGIRIYADTLFRSFSIFEDGAKVYLSVEKRNCLPVADQASGAA